MRYGFTDIWGLGLDRKEGKAMKKEIYTVHGENDDLTFIMEDTYIDDKCYSTECVGFYFGAPDEELTKQYYGKLKAEFEGGL